VRLYTPSKDERARHSFPTIRIRRRSIPDSINPSSYRGLCAAEAIGVDIVGTDQVWHEH